MLLDQSVLREKRLHIVTLAPEAECHCQRGISYLFDDIREFPFKDGLYDVVVSLSSLELYSADGWQLARDEDCSSAEYVDWVAELMRTGRRPDTVVHQPDYASAARAVACVRLIKA